MCTRKPQLFLVSQASGLIIPAHCKAYACSQCGPKKIRSLFFAIKKQLEKWELVRFWTFTLTNRIFESKEKHYEALREIWRRWINNIRRSKLLRAKTKSFAFVKVVEMHKSGFLHLHVFLSEFLPQTVAQTLWETCCQEVTGHQGHLGQTYVKGHRSARQGAWYVCKYVMKLIHLLEMTFRKYSKSNDIILFPKKITVNEWFFIRTMQIDQKDLYDEIAEFSPSLVFIKHNFPDDLEKSG